jgi:hypothetical protein
MNDGKILRDVLDEFMSGINVHQPERVAALFTEDGIFRGLGPYSVGRGWRRITAANRRT